MPSGRVDLFEPLCRFHPYSCTEYDYSLDGEDLLGTRMHVANCLDGEKAILAGSWSIDDAAARPFEWEAEVRRGAIFPLPRHWATSIGCGNIHPPTFSPAALMVRDPGGFEWAALEGDDVFIPLRGKATIDGVEARAALDGIDGGSAPRVTVSTTSTPAPHGPAARARLASGDSFAWGSHIARIVRIVEPQGGSLGAVGWVTIALSEGGPPGGDP
ncbi:MAG TPA: hypothetical protein VH044_13385 [Polyangiaceae bacterium]|jgi:hypothetical protein|nr:hypothetical protein [Polyangiaceae bacterium]